MAVPKNQTYRMEPSLHINLGIGLTTGKQPYSHPLFIDERASNFAFKEDSSDKIALESNGPSFTLGVSMPIRINTGHFLKFSANAHYGLSKYFQQVAWDVGIGTEHRLTKQLAAFWNFAYMGQYTLFKDRSLNNGFVIPGDSYIQHGGLATIGLVAYFTPKIALELYFGGKLFQANKIEGLINNDFDLGMIAGVNLRFDVVGNNDMMQ